MSVQHFGRYALWPSSGISFMDINKDEDNSLKNHNTTNYNQTSSHTFREINNLQLSYLPTPPLGQDMTQGQFLSGV